MQFCSQDLIWEIGAASFSLLKHEKRGKFIIYNGADPGSIYIGFNQIKVAETVVPRLIQLVALVQYSCFVDVVVAHAIDRPRMINNIHGDWVNCKTPQFGKESLSLFRPKKGSKVYDHN